MEVDDDPVTSGVRIRMPGAWGRWTGGAIWWNLVTHRRPTFAWFHGTLSRTWTGSRLEGVLTLGSPYARRWMAQPLVTLAGAVLGSASFWVADGLLRRLLPMLDPDGRLITWIVLVSVLVTAVSIADATG